MDIEQARYNMIEQQIRPWDVLDVDVLKIIKETPRELFVPKQHQNLAFSDLEIPLRNGQFMMTPKVEARMLQALQIKSSDEILEIGTGSGIIAITLILEKIVNHIVATDISDQALIIAKRNIKKYNISKRISLLKHNFILDGLKKQSFDLVISNPPYIAKDTYHNLPQHIKNYEPRLALTDEQDGLVFYRRFAQCLPDILNKRGIFLCEFGDIQALSKIKKIFTQKGYFFKIINDYNNVPRILKVGLYDIKNN